MPNTKPDVKDPSLMKDYAIDGDKLKGFTLYIPEYSDWQCKMFGHSNSLVFRPIKGEEPCWFHRKLQELILGHKWEKAQ